MITTKNHVPLLMCIHTPKELLQYMHSIQYGFYHNVLNIKVLSKHFTEDIEDHMFDRYYRLQSPGDTIKYKIGVCWDQVEVEREWFSLHNYHFNIFYFELVDGVSCPTHTFLVYQDRDKTGSYYWFEHSWEMYMRIHKFSSLKAALKHISQKFRIVYRNDSSPLMVRILNDTPKYGLNPIQYMDFAHKQHNVNMAL